MKFVCDTMLARLARWLRIMGIEAEYYGVVDDDMLIKKRPKGAIILTRDRELAKRLEAQPCYFVRSNKIWGQIKEVTAQFGIGVDPDKMLSLCPLCGLELEAIEREGARGLVPPFVYARAKKFYICSNCAKVFWDATHTRNMKRILAQTFGHSGQSDES